MRKLTRSILAATAVVGLLALPIAGAGAASEGTTTTTLSLASTAGTVSVTVPDGTVAAPKNLTATAQDIATGPFTTDAMGTVTATDTRTGLLRVTTVNTATALPNALLAFCQDTDGASGDIDGTLACSTDATKQIPLASAIYNFGTVDTTGSTSGLTPPTATDGQLGVANLANASALTGEQVWSWSPTFTVTLLGTELEGKYYGAVKHSIS